ncbi:MAG TPA: DUF418 domain-containing protein [Burkholderiaceae bacterium]|nr:DUF418 domain-containing protein [Burkholderiaceae bacterium]
MASVQATVRDERIDALRGFALFGILLVNIQSFLYGAANPIGYLTPDAGTLDRVTLFATAALVNVKFMPLFAMLFGAGFSLLYAKLKTMTAEPRRIYRRRMLFLFVFGVLHGIFFYFGDITQMYAVAGIVLLLYVDRDVTAIARAARNWWIGMAVFTAGVFVLVGPAVTLPEQYVAEVKSNFEVFSHGSYVEQLPVRVGEFGDLIVGNLFGFPLIVALMLTGMLAQRAEWLQQRDARAWRTASALGLLIGLPAALLYGYWLLSDVEAYGLAATPQGATVPMLLSIALSFFYASAFLRHAPPRVIALLAPAGRMPLTNYLLQSIAMGALLSGWGLALGPHLNYWQTAALAMLIVVGQIILSSLWLGPMQMKQGPLEALWRAWTYRGLSKSATRTAT